MPGFMKPSGLLAALAAALLLWVVPLAAHPSPFSYLDLRMGAQAIETTLVVHVLDVAHDLDVVPADRLHDAAFVTERAGAIAALVEGRVTVGVNGRALRVAWTDIRPLPDRQALQLSARIALEAPVGTLTVDGRLFPYDPRHQTFINVYEGRALTQAIIDGRRARFEYFAGTRQGVVAVLRKFVPAGVHHILIGPDHILFLVGLLLLGGSMRRLVLIVTGFTVAHSLTLTLAALNILSPPAWVIEPAIALSIVYVGVDNLLVRQGRDVRAWLALGFGFIHGFGFANVLRDMGLPARALGWSLFSFNVGVEIGQLAIVSVVATVLAAVRSRSEALGRRIAVVGSVVVIVMGAFWFIQRVVFSGEVR
jgi:hydrogenase/urease accessory protein HupE